MRFYSFTVVFLFFVLLSAPLLPKGVLAAEGADFNGSWTATDTEQRKHFISVDYDKGRVEYQMFNPGQGHSWTTFFSDRADPFAVRDGRFLIRSSGGELFFRLAGPDTIVAFGTDSGILELQRVRNIDNTEPFATPWSRLRDMPTVRDAETKQNLMDISYDSPFLHFLYKDAVSIAGAGSYPILSIVDVQQPGNRIILIGGGKGLDRILLRMEKSDGTDKWKVVMRRHDVMHPVGEFVDVLGR